MKEILEYILRMGAPVVMPIIVTILGLVLRVRFSKAFRAGLTIGVGMIAINLVIGLMSDSITPAAKAMTERFGLSLTIVDVGWPITAAISLSTSIVPAVFLVGIVINITMLALNWTKTLNIDFWNYWHFIFAGALIQYLTNNMYLGILGAAITFIVIIKLADFSAPIVQKYYDMPGVSLPHTETVSWVPVCLGLNWVYDHIPIIKNIDWSHEKIQKRFGLLGEPIMLGLILGIGLGILAGYAPDKVILLGVNIAAVMLILPRMVRILMEGLLPLSEGAREFIEKHFPGKKLYVGLDAAIAVGSPSIITTGLLMIPITLLLAFILPGNRTLPMVDLAVMPFFCIWPVLASKNNLFRSLLTSILTMIAVLYIASDVARVSTIMANASGFALPKGTSIITSLNAGAHLVPYILYKAAELIHGLGLF